jgi:hypothetical protein
MRGTLVRLPLEVQLYVVRWLGAEATLIDWARLRSEHATWSVGIDALFDEWLRMRSVGSRFSHFHGRGDCELQFVMDHIRSAFLS